MWMIYAILQNHKRSDEPWHPPVLVSIILYITMLVMQQTDFYYVQNWCNLEFTNLSRENNLGDRVNLCFRWCKTTKAYYLWLCALGSIFQDSRQIFPLIPPKGDVHKGKFKMNGWTVMFNSEKLWIIVFEGRWNGGFLHKEGFALVCDTSETLFFWWACGVMFLTKSRYSSMDKHGCVVYQRQCLNRDIN